MSGAVESCVEMPPAGILVRALAAFLATATLTGIAGALFLRTLEAVTLWHQAQPRLLLLLPLLGLGVWWIYQRFAGIAARGTNLLIEQIHQPSSGVPFRLAPLIFFTTLLTHLGGGSAGREGTAVQMGGGIGGGIASLFKLTPEETRHALLSGMAAGFGAVFGTPWAGAVFAVECIHPRRPDWRRLPACMAAAWIGHWICIGCGAVHADYRVALPAPTGPLLGTVSLTWTVGSLAAGIAFGLIARAYVLAGKSASRGFALIPWAWMRPVAGAALLMLLTLGLGTRAFLGLGATPMDPGNASIATALETSAIPPWAWAAKLAFTVITLSSGFKGGEVTPLFFIGATAGNTLSPLVGLPVGLGAALGLTAVFAGASRTPVACTLMGMELFGLGHGPYLAIACHAAWLTAGRNGIYEAQNRPPE